MMTWAGSHSSKTDIGESINEQMNRNVLLMKPSTCKLYIGVSLYTVS